jgi:hypothetical protein
MTLSALQWAFDFEICIDYHIQTDMKICPTPNYKHMTNSCTKYLIWPVMRIVPVSHYVSWKAAPSPLPKPTSFHHGQKTRVIYLELQTAVQDQGHLLSQWWQQWNLHSHKMCSLLYLCDMYSEHLHLLVTTFLIHLNQSCYTNCCSGVSSTCVSCSGGPVFTSQPHHAVLTEGLYGFSQHFQLIAEMEPLITLVNKF